MASDAGQPPALELDLKRYEVRLHGSPLRLERRPMELLILLLEHPGELVTREAIQRRLWSDDVFVDVDQGINTAINKIRQALKDDPGQPRFLQTVIGKGYRFVGPVTRIADDASRTGTPAAPSFTECALVWEGRSIVLADGVNVIGRDSEATLVIDSSTVSRKHAQIVVSGPVATIEDLGSKNRTQLNGQPLEGRVRLADYDVIQIGPATLIFRLSSPTGSTLTAAVSR
jgi:DNA-binding winged helix-turn-helix (wHTH) protein